MNPLRPLVCHGLREVFRALFTFRLLKSGPRSVWMRARHIQIGSQQEFVDDVKDAVEKALSDSEAAFPAARVTTGVGHMVATGCTIMSHLLDPCRPTNANSSTDEVMAGPSMRGVWLYGGY